MLQIKNVVKHYKTGGTVTKALDGVSLSFRDSEFVSILGASGSGKSTLLNIVGGLDHYDSGDMLINGTSTCYYRNREWDSYRNHTIGFVFQSYNLIQHQTILSNVELALTISGISKSERQERAKKALEEVGLGEQIRKKPSQLSGGQMQRVAIARALVNDPDIVLADEPTGALDTVTSVQIMEILKKIAKNRLVVMVTHNPELAEKYSTRIVRLSDGKIVSDTNPFEVEDKEKSYEETKKATVEQTKKSKMSFSTALGLSFNNLLTKKGRTIMISIAGSVGIIGIALILALTNGVNAAIATNEQTSTDPITVSQTVADSDKTVAALTGGSKTEEELNDMTGVEADFASMKTADGLSAGAIKVNDVKSFKQNYLDNPNSEIYKYVSKEDVVYTYDVPFNTYTNDANNVKVDVDSKTDELVGGTTSTSSNDKTMMFRMLPGENGQLVSNTVKDKCSMVYGELPQKSDEIMLFIDKNNSLSPDILYRLGLITASQYKDYYKQANAGVTIDSLNIDYSDICGKEFYLVPACDQYKKAGDGTYAKIESTNTSEYTKMIENGIKLKISGIARSKEESFSLTGTKIIDSTLGYTDALLSELAQISNSSEIVQAQEANPNINILTGLPFGAKSDEEKISIIKDYMKDSGIANTDNMSDQQCINLFDSYVGSTTYEQNLKNLGKIDFDSPKGISIYAISSEKRDAVASCIDKYNESVGEQSKITYTDMAKNIAKGLTTMTGLIQAVLIIIAAISLIVAAIMIGIITHISVLERTKEIGILRALGASKKNVSQVFTAENCLIGILAGLIGVVVTILLGIAITAALPSLGIDITVAINPIQAILLIVVSTLITVIGGITPSKKAAKLDPVQALRTE